MDTPAMIDIPAWIADHAWGLIGIGAVLSLALALLQHRSLWNKRRGEKGRVNPLVLCELVLLWAVPVITILATVAAQFGSDSTDRKLVALDPRNRPVMSVTAHAVLTVRGQPKIVRWDNEALGIANLNCGRSWQARSNLWIVFLVADKFVTSVGQNDTQFYMDFHMEPVFPMGNIREGDPAKILDEMDTLAIHAPFLPWNSEILDGSVMVKVNDTVQKEPRCSLASSKRGFSAAMAEGEC